MYQWRFFLILISNLKFKLNSFDIKFWVVLNSIQLVTLIIKWQRCLCIWFCLKLYWILIYKTWFNNLHWFSNRPKDLKFARNLLIPKKGTVYDHVYIKKQYGAWCQWSSLIQAFSIDDKAKVTLKMNVIFCWKCQRKLDFDVLSFDKCLKLCFIRCGIQ